MNSKVDGLVFWLGAFFLISIGLRFVPQDGTTDARLAANFSTASAFVTVVLLAVFIIRAVVRRTGQKSN